MSKPLHRRAIGFDAPVSPTDTLAVLLGLATIPGQPRIVLEAVARDHTAAWRIGADEPVLPKLRALFRAHLPDVSLRPTNSVFSDISIEEARSVSAAHSRTVPLRHDVASIEQVTRQLFDVFASTAASDVLRLQLILGPRTAPKQAPVIDGISRTVIEGKFGQYGFGCALRIAVRAGHPARAKQLLSATAACFRCWKFPEFGSVPGAAVVVTSTNFARRSSGRSGCRLTIWSRSPAGRSLATPITNFQRCHADTRNCCQRPRHTPGTGGLSVTPPSPPVAVSPVPSLNPKMMRCGTLTSSGSMAPANPPS